MGLGGFLKKLAGPVAGIGAGILTSNPAIGLGVAGAVSGAFKQGDANDITQEQLEIIRQDIADRKPLREAFSQRALQPIAGAPNLSGAFSATSSNPFSPLAQGGEPVSLANVIPPDPGFQPEPKKAQPVEPATPQGGSLHFRKAQQRFGRS